MEWKYKKGYNSPDKSSWFGGTYVIELADTTKIINTFFRSRAVWYPKGVLSITLNVHLPIRAHQEKSRKRVGRALSDLFQTSGGWICVVSDGKLERGGKTIFTTVEWYSRCKALPTAETVEMVKEVVESNLIAEEYLATVVATGETETYEWFELPGNTGMRAIIRDSCFTGKTVKGRKWQIV